MSARFRASVPPQAGQLTDIGRLNPRSPFNSPAYAEALRSSGTATGVFALEDAGRITGGCIATLAGPRWLRRVEIQSTPELGDAVPFWDGVFSWCRDNGICDLEVLSFASVSPTMPAQAAPAFERDRIEYVVDLSKADRQGDYSKNHARSIRKASRSGLCVARSRDRQDYVTHVSLMAASMHRRSDRGEDVPVPAVHPLDIALLEHGVGELFRASVDGKTVASILILRSPESGYYQSAGTHPDGLAIGASQFLIDHVAACLADEGTRYFNLGGADVDADGLRRFKSGFGAEEIALRALRYEFASPASRGLRRVASKLWRMPQALRRLARRGR